MKKHSHIAVFGYPRSGSTMFYCMLRATVQGYIFYDREIRAILAMRNNKNTPKITKNPMDILDVSFLNREIKDIKFILCIRDPRSVLCSKIKGDQFKVNWNYCIHKKGAIKERNVGFMERDHLVRETLKYNPFICKYEDVVNNPNEVQKKLGDLLGLEYKGKFSNFHEEKIPTKLRIRLNGKRPVETVRIDSWKEYPKRIYKQFTECPELFEVLEFWGYEKDRTWFDQLKKEIEC